MSEPVDPFLPAASLEGVPSAFAATRDGIDALLRDRGLRRTTPEDTARSLLLGAVATARLEGSELPPVTDDERLDHESGLGLSLMDRLADGAVVETGPDGTLVRLTVHHS